MCQWWKPCKSRWKFHRLGTHLEDVVPETRANAGPGRWGFGETYLANGQPAPETFGDYIPVDGSEIRRLPVEVGSFIPLFTGFYTSQVQDFFHQQYLVGKIRFKLLFQGPGRLSKVTFQGRTVYGKNFGEVTFLLKIPEALGLDRQAAGCRRFFFGGKWVEFRFVWWEINGDELGDYCTAQQEVSFLESIYFLFLLACQVQYEDQVVQVPVQKQVHVPMVQTVQKHIEIPQIEYQDEIVEVPVQWLANLLEICGAKNPVGWKLETPKNVK